MTLAQERFEDLVDDLLGEAGVTPPSGGGGFGRSALRCDGKIFAMLVRGQLVLKLPGQRVDELIGQGDGRRFDANKGTPMREWLSLDPGSALPWLPLANEALAFARAARPRPGRTGAPRPALISRPVLPGATAGSASRSPRRSRHCRRGRSHSRSACRPPPGSGPRP